MKSAFVALLLGRALLVLTVASSALPPPAVTIKVDKDHIDFLIGKDVVTTYQIKDNLPRPFFYPVKTVDGIEATRAWPMGKALPGEKTDHVHHRSVWFCYGDIIPEGLDIKNKPKGVEGVDFWSEGKYHGNIICTKVGEPTLGPDQAWITTQNEWRDAEGRKILDETRKIGFFNHGKAYFIVLDIDLFASVYPLTFGDTKEGAMAIRIHPDINVKPGKGKIENAEGKINEKECWGHKSMWCDYSGPIGDKVVGVTIFDDPRNRFAACWHARDYGLMAANPFGRTASGFPDAKSEAQRVRLAKGEHLYLRYGVLVHSGDAREAGVADLWKAFTRIPRSDK